MKKHFCLLLAAVISIVLGCSKSDPENPEPEVPKQETITIAGGADAVPVLGTSGGSASVTFTASAAWSASVINTRASDWCSVSPTSGGAGAATITITAKENVTPDNRAASITITAGNATRTIKVEQKQKDALTVSQSSFEVPAEGKEIKVVAKSNVSFTHTISEDAKAWIKIIGTKALKDSTLTFEIAKNDNIDKRSGEIYLASGNLKDTIKVHQAGETPSIVISKDEYVLKSEGETFEVEVASNVNASMNLVFPDGVEPWMAENTTRAMSTNKYVFTAQSNEAYDSRSAMIIFANVENNLSDTVRVTQAQKDAIVVAKSEYEFGMDGGNLDFEILKNVEISVNIPDSCSNWIKHLTTRGLETEVLYFDVLANYGNDSCRTGYIILSGGNTYQYIKITQQGLSEVLTAEREALVNLYEATNGDNWVNNDNWCSDRPISEWYGISYDNNIKRVVGINLSDNNLVGVIPESIGSFEKLEYLFLSDNRLCGSIPESIGELKILQSLVLSHNYLSGSIPKQIGQLDNLSTLMLFYNNLSNNIPDEICNLDKLEQLHLNGNKLTGCIPENIVNLKKIRTIDLTQNYLSGDIPNSFFNWGFWRYAWGHILEDNNLNVENLRLPAIDAVVKSMDNETISLQEEYKKNKYTILFQWSHDAATSFILPQLKSIYQSNFDQGVNIIGWTASYNTPSIEDAKSYVSETQMPWKNFYFDKWNDVNKISDYECYPSNYTPSITVVDSLGTIVFSDFFDHNIYVNDGYFNELFNNNFKKGKGDLYKSTDYSADKSVTLLQKASDGKGIDIVLVGDAFSDRLVADGTYDRVMRRAADHIFAEEPYKSYRELFNVYYVTAISENEVYGQQSSTAFSCYFVEEPMVGGDDYKVLTYGEKAIGAERIDDALFVVIMNSSEHGGTCDMYVPSSTLYVPAYHNWGSGLTIAYSCLGDSDEYFAATLKHEACGHGFARLADEYYMYNSVISESGINFYKSHEQYGWWKNIDFTGEPTQVKWSKFLADSRYKYDGLGVYEGGLAEYSEGVWRPSENSIMSSNTGGFNAPSREAIYYRIHKLAYGADWQYDYEKFVEYDVRNRMSEAQSQSRPLVLKPQEKFVPLHPPVVIPYSWREVYKQAR